MSYYDDMNEMTREGGAPSKDGGEAVSSEHCPDHPDFGLLDKALHGLDGALGGDMLPLDKVVPDVDLPSVVFMAKQRALKVLYETGAGSGSFGRAWMDGFMAGVMFQRLKAKQTLSGLARNFGDVFELWSGGQCGVGVVVGGDALE